MIVVLCVRSSGLVCLSVEQRIVYSWGVAWNLEVWVEVFIGDTCFVKVALFIL